MRRWTDMEKHDIINSDASLKELAYRYKATYKAIQSLRKRELNKCKWIDEPGQTIYKFKNGYGASIVDTSFKTVKDLSVIKFDKRECWEICYNTPITDNVLRLHVSYIDEIIKKIKEL